MPSVQYLSCSTESPGQWEEYNKCYIILHSGMKPLFCGRRKKQRTVPVSHDKFASTYGEIHIAKQNEVSGGECKTSKTQWSENGNLNHA
jgi:hypothetical protein